MANYFFDDLDEANAAYAPNSEPIWTLDLNEKRDEQAVLDWLNAEAVFLDHRNEDRILLQRRNLALFKGIQYQELEARIDNRGRAQDRSNYSRKIVPNHLFDLTKNRAGRLVKFRPAVAILPTTDETEDKFAAKACKGLLDHVWYEQDFEGQIQLELAIHAMVMGESYLFITWDKDSGPVSPAFKAAKKEAKDGRIPLLDENGQPVLDGRGKPRFVENEVRIGDVSYRIHLSPEVLLQDKQYLHEVDYCFTREVINADELRIRYPEKADKIKSGQQAQIYDYERMETMPSRKDVIVYTFWHRPTKGLTKGRVIKFINGCILESEEYPFTHGKLPFVRFTDQEFPGELYGKSFFEIIKGLTSTYNNLTNMIMRNILMVSHPKWMVPAGSVALDKLGNDITLVQYKGPVPPQLAIAQVTPPEVYSFRDKLKEEFQQISGVFGVSRGEPPPGIKAGVALQFLSEQESERYNELVLKWNEVIRQVAEMTLQVAHDFYHESDKRMVRILGKNQEYLTEYFNAADLARDYDIRIQNSSALPKSVAARTQTLLDLSERFPDKFTAEQVIDMLDLAQSDKFVDSATVAVRTAEAETEKLVEISAQEASALEPEEFENHLLHWRIHTRQVQEFSFKYKTPDEQQSNLVNHILVHEMFMVEQAKSNPKFAEMLAQLELFPMFYKITAQAPAPAPAPMPANMAGMMPPGMGIPAGPGMPLDQFQAQQLPASPLVGGEAQLPVNVTPPNIETQIGLGGPLEPTRGI